MALDREQRHVASYIVRRGRQRREPARRILAALETGIVEQGLHNRPGGSGSSSGWRQETRESYPNANRTDLRASVDRFYDEARRASGRRAGDIAAAVQRPAAQYRGRYNQVAGQARSIFRQFDRGGSGSGGGSGGSLSVDVQRPMPQVGDTLATDLLSQSLRGSKVPVPASSPPAPAITARRSLHLPQGAQTVPESGASVPASSLADQLRQIQNLQGPAIPKPQVTVTGTEAGGSGGTTGARGKVVGKPIDRSGVSTHPGVVRFVEKVAGVLGSPIKLGTGTQHSRLTTSGNVSDHWQGEALDLPSTGKRNIQIGHAALIAAGMSPARARKAKGGIYNVGGWQIIFQTTQGGNHFNHVHVGFRAGR